MFIFFFEDSPTNHRNFFQNPDTQKLLPRQTFSQNKFRYSIITNCMLSKAKVGTLCDAGLLAAIIDSVFKHTRQTARK